MAINLQKGQTIDLRKNDKGENIHDLSSVTIGLGWDVSDVYKEIKVEIPQSFLEKISGKQRYESKKVKVEAEYDLDAIAFLLDENNKVADLGDKKLIGGDVIFFNSLRHDSGHIWLTGDNRTGAGDGDDEQIIVKLDSLDKKYQKILFLVSIYDGKKKSQNFSMVENAFIRAVDAKSKEITKYSLSGDASLNGMCTMVFAEVYRKDTGWKFRAIGEPYQTDSFVDILKKYIY